MYEKEICKSEIEFGFDKNLFGDCKIGFGVDKVGIGNCKNDFVEQGVECSENVNEIGKF